jgi:hypothetical protein
MVILMTRNPTIPDRILPISACPRESTSKARESNESLTT